MRARNLALTVLLASAVCSVVGCATIQPYEREHLARTDMQFGGAAELESAEDHATEVREGAVGGFDAVGGGCGCN